MSYPDSDPTRVRTLGIRFEPDIHADITLIAGLRGTSFQAQVIEACRALVAAVKASPELANKADEALAEIEREAALRRDAFARLFGNAAPATDPTLPTDAETAEVERRRDTDGQGGTNCSGFLPEVKQHVPERRDRDRERRQPHQLVTWLAASAYPVQLRQGPDGSRATGRQSVHSHHPPLPANPE